MKPGDMVRIRSTKLLNSQLGSPLEYEEWWEEGCILVEYHTWEKIATILHNGEIKRIEINDVQLASRSQK